MPRAPNPGGIGPSEGLTKGRMVLSPPKGRGMRNYAHRCDAAALAKDERLSILVRLDGCAW